MRSVTVAAHLWKWFRLHNSRYVNIMKSPTKKAYEYQLNELQVHVRAYCKWLGADVIPDEKNGGGTLIITAFGRPIGFRRADMLVATAPEIPNWTIVSLRQPCPPGEFVIALNKTIDTEPDNCWFHYLYKDRKGHCVLVIYVDCILPGKVNETWEFVHLQIENLLGERSQALDTQLKDIRPRCDAPESAMLYQLAELPAFIGSIKSTIKIDKNGKLEGW